MSRIAAAQQEKWKEISTMPYAAQCKWVLNGFWEQLEAEAENVWTWCETFVRLDLMGPDKKGRDGCDLDEFWSHKFLETLGETMTVIEMREKFRKIDADFNKRMSMIEWLAYRFNLKISDVIDAPQGENKEGIARAQAMVDAAQAAVEDMNRKLAASKAATAVAKDAAAKSKAAAAAAKEAAMKAKAAAEASKKAAEAAWFAEQENKKALEELHAQEAAFEKKKAELTKIKEDQSLGVVRRNKAANELDQMLSEDPLPLRKAKINQAATVKKSERARAAAEEAKAKAEADAAAAEKAARDAENAQHAAEAAQVAAEDAQRAAEAAQAKAEATQAAAEAAEAEAVAAEQAAEAAVHEAEARFQVALDFLEAEKKKGGIAQGDIWWMQREITEKKKYLPASKQK